MSHNRYSNYKIAWFPEKLWAMRTGQLTAPLYVRIKPTNVCCHNCDFCVYKPSVSKMHGDANRTDSIPPAKLREIIDDLSAVEVKAVTFSGGGEPLCYPAIADSMQQVLDAGMDLSIITNGQSMNGASASVLTKAKWIRVSMDYYNAEMMERIRHIPQPYFQVICQNMLWMSEHKSKCCDLTVNYIITKHNYQNLLEAAQLMRGLGVEILRFSPVWTPNFLEYHKPLQDVVLMQLQEIIGAASDSFQVHHSYFITEAQTQHNGNRCYFCEIVPVIAANQKVYACHNKAYDETGCLCDLCDTPFRKAWFNALTEQRIRALNPSLHCNHQCANWIKNEIISKIMKGYGDNFI